MQTPTFQEWKEHIKTREKKFWKPVMEDHKSIELAHLLFPHLYAKAHLCETLTTKLHEKGITHSFIANYQGFDNDKKISLIYYLLFLHKGTMLTAHILAMQNDHWKPLNVQIRRAGHHWESLELYEEELSHVKESFLDVVTQDPMIRLFVVTGLIKEKQKG